MATELNECIEKLRPVATSRGSVVRASAVGRRRHSPGEQRAARKETEAVLIREAQRVGVLPALLIPFLWQILYAVALMAIQFWVEQIHSPTPDPVPPETL